MSSARDVTWKLTPHPNGNYSHSDAELAVMMDIRDELKSLNRLLQCPNFLDIPKRLRKIDRNTARRRPKE